MRAVCAFAAALLLAAGLSAEERKPWPVPPEVKARKNPVAATPTSVRDAGRLYRQLCLICHGENGDGHGPWRDRMATDPSDFTDAKRMRAMTDGEIFWRLSHGRGLMPGFENQLSQRQRWGLVNYLHTLAAKSSGLPPPAAKTGQ